MSSNFKYILYAYFLVFLSIKTQILYIGNMKSGFSFQLLPKMPVDYLNQYIFSCSKEEIIQNNYGSLSFSISVCDIKNNPNRFIPVITKNSIINGILESNPLYECGFNKFDLLLGTEFEPKFYPIANPINSSKIYIINNLELYTNEKNKLISTDPLLDINLEEGNIITLNSIQNKFIAGVIEKNTIFGNNNPCQFYQYNIKEKILQIPGNSNYITLINLEKPMTFLLNKESTALCISNESSVNLISNYLCTHGNQTLNKFYIGVSGQGATGIKAVTIQDQPILFQSNENALNGNNIVATNLINTNLYINQLSSIFTSTGLSYLIISGGTIDQNKSISSVHAIPLINYSTENINSIGTLADINQKPITIFDSNSPYNFICNALISPPQNKGDLYDENSKEAIVGASPLIHTINSIDYQLRINDVQGYKDTIFVSTSYMNKDQNGIGGIFYSQALFNEYGIIKRWTKWQRKNIYGNCQTQSYIPTIGSNIAIYENINNQIIGNQFSSSGPFLSQINMQNNELPCSASGIEKIVDIPYTHPGIGENIYNIIGLKPSYLIAVGYKTVILQQTAKNNSLLPILTGNIINCINGTSGKINDKNSETNIITFQGGVLESAGALFSAAIGYSQNDSWLIAAGENGIYILSDNNGNGFGPKLLQDNFVGFNANLSWKKLGNFKTVKKIVSNKDFLYVITNKTIYRIDLNKENIKLQKNCKYQIILKHTDLPNSTEYSSFSDGLFSNNVCILATSIGLFTNKLNSSIKTTNIISVEQIKLPEAFGCMPIYLYPITIDGNADSWGYGENTDITGNIYLMATSLTQHYSKLYRLICYGNNTNNQDTIFLLPNYFIKNFPTYYYNPNIELLSIATDGASLFSHGIYGNSILYRSYIGILNPFIRHGNLGLKNEYNFFELASKTNSYFGYPTYISGIGIWLFSSQNGIQGLC